jgi:predicted transcriptional regulator
MFSPNRKGEAAMSTDIEFVKREILELFAESRARTGDALNVRALLHSRMVRWNPKQRDALQPAVDELASEGLVVKRDDNCFLTDKGVDYIYPEPGDSIRDAILDFFRMNNARSGHAFNARAFYHQQMIHWNPKEQKAFDPAIQELEAAGLVEKREDALFLTDKGFEAIY